MTTQTLTQTELFSNASVAWDSFTWDSFSWDQNTFYSPTVTQPQDLSQASRFDNSNTFYGPTITPGPAALSPALYSNTNTFYAPTLTTSYALTPNRFDNTNAFYAPSVIPGAVTLAPVRHDNSNAFYAFDVTYTEYRYARPAADVSDGSWLPSAGADLYAVIDETVADDADYIYTDTGSSPAEIALAPVLDPGTSNGHTLKVRASSSQANSLTFTLKQGATTIATKTQSPVSASPTDYTLTLTGAEIDAITDYTDLRLEVTAS